MKTLHLFLLLIIISSCNDQSESVPAADKQEKSVISEPVNTVSVLTQTIAGDPTFVIPKDTVSMFGPRDITRSMLQDKNGNLWFASWDGIIKYDGRSFTNMMLRLGLVHYHYFSLLEDRKGNIWFGTVRGGLYCYDGKNVKYFTTKDGLAGDLVFCIAEDRLGNIWIGTDQGVSCYSGKSFVNFTTENGLQNNLVYAILPDRSGNIWFGTHGGMSYCNESTYTKLIENYDLPVNVRAIIQDKNGDLWFGSNTSGLFRYDPIKKNDPINISPNATSYILEDKNGALWCSMQKTNSSGMWLIKYEPHSVLGTATFTDIANGPQIFGGVEDSNGNIWFGGVNGVSYYDPAKGLSDKNAFTFFTEPLSK